MRTASGWYKAFLVNSAFAAVMCLSAVAPATEASWTEMAEGIHYAVLNAQSSRGEVEFAVARIDPVRAELVLLCAGEVNDGKDRSAMDWCRDFKLAAAINAGMFREDRRTNVGYMRNGGYTNNRRNHPQYHSAAAFNPRRGDLPAFKIFELDATPLDDINEAYTTVVQNLRLIKRAGENRWQASERSWSEAALGEDAEGRALFIHCATPLTMHEFNALLLALPLGVVAAQHLEGGIEAQLAVPKARGRNAEGIYQMIAPNVIGARPRQP